ncbi:MAG TPA: c-type cytochrome [Gaiellaceae bacterium]|nr:c-type cytochrome [Gaiellaceae bacterium]
MSNERERAYFKRYKEDVETRGKPFYPYAMFHDTVMSLVVVSVIVGLACVWYFTSGEEAGDAGILGPRYTEEADPGTTSFIPRPDWYFYFLFYLLRIFKWPESVVLGTVGIPTIALILLVMLPFLDRRRERRIVRRPVAVVAALLVIASMGILTYKGATAEESLASENVELVDEWVQVQGLSEDGRQGAELFAQSGCQSCHTYLDSGSANLGAPDLSEIGAAGQSPEELAAYIANPAEFGNQVMPAYADLGEENLRLLGTFLSESKGEGGGG